MLRLAVGVLMTLAKPGLTLLMIVTASVHVVFRLPKMLWMTLTVLFPLTALYEQSAGPNCSMFVLSHSTHCLIEEAASFMCIIGYI